MNQIFVAFSEYLKFNRDFNAFLSFILYFSPLFAHENLAGFASSIYKVFCMYRMYNLLTECYFIPICII